MSDGIRSRSQFEDGFWVGDWFVEPMLNRVRYDDEDEPVQLEPKVMEVLLCMAERPGKTVTKSQFKEKVWTDTVVTDDVLSRCISELRKVFDDDSRDPLYIETIRKTGYRLIAPVRVPNPEEPSSAAPGDGSASSPTTSEHSRPFQGLAEKLSENLQGPRADTRNSWLEGAGGLLQRKWILGLSSFAAVLLLLAILSWTEMQTDPPSKPPNPATPLTSFPGEEFDPALSSIGRQIVFAWRNADSLYQNIYLMQRGADRPLQLSTDTTVDWSPAWSPEGRYVAYARNVRGEHQVYIVPSIGGRGRLVTRLPKRRIESVAWAPDTSESILAISAQQRPHQAFGLTLRFPNTDSSIALTTPPLWSTGDTSPTFSPDGSRIAFVRGTVKGVEDVFVLPVSGGSPRQVTTDSTTIHGLAWAEDGEHIIYSARRKGVSGLWRIDVNGGSPSLLRSASEGTHFTHPSVSDQQLVYTQQSAQLDIWKLGRPNRYATFQAEQILSSTQEESHPSISPKGTQLAFISKRSGHPEVWTSEMNGTSPAQITSLNGPDIRSVTWSSGGDQLCFVARKNGKSNLFVVPASGGPVTQLTNTPAEVLTPRWSRNDRWVYFASNKTGAWEIWRASLDSSQVQRVTEGGGIAAQESVSRSTLYLVRPDTTGIWATPLDTARFPIRTDSRSASSENLLARAQIPDSLNMSGPESSVVLSGVSPVPQESPLRQVVDQLKPRDRMNWWVDEEGIYFLHHRRFRTAVLTYFDITSGRAVPLYTFPDWRSGQHIAVGPKGVVFAYTHVGRRESDVMLVEDVKK